MIGLASHQCRLMLEEKRVEFQIREVHPTDDFSLINRLNPVNGSLPILEDRDLVLPEAELICQYLDERYLVPELMPEDSTERAQVRLFLHNFNNELFVYTNRLDGDLDDIASKVVLQDRLTQLAPLFTKNLFILGKDISILDIMLAPLLWRLEHYGIELSKNTSGPLMQYANRLFARPAFSKSLTAAERLMRQ